MALNSHGALGVVMDKLQVVREALGMVAIVLGFAGAVLMLALVDTGLTLLLVRWARKVKRLAELPQPGVPLPQLPPDHRVTVLGGAVRKWE
jgi:hypothetical protein